MERGSSDHAAGCLGHAEELAGSIPAASVCLRQLRLEGAARANIP
jgi:hypothetical protein